MLTIEDLTRTVDKEITAGHIQEKNYWVYISLSKSDCYASQEESPRAGYIGYFCEDTSRLNGIYTIAERKTKRCKEF